MPSVQCIASMMGSSLHRPLHSGDSLGGECIPCSPTGKPTIKRMTSPPEFLAVLRRVSGWPADHLSPRLLHAMVLYILTVALCRYREFIMLLNRAEKHILHHYMI